MVLQSRICYHRISFHSIGNGCSAVFVYTKKKKNTLSSSCQSPRLDLLVVHCSDRVSLSLSSVMQSSRLVYIYVSFGAQIDLLLFRAWGHVIYRKRVIAELRRSRAIALYIYREKGNCCASESPARIVYRTNNMTTMTMKIQNVCDIAIWTCQYVQFIMEGPYAEMVLDLVVISRERSANAISIRGAYFFVYLVILKLFSIPRRLTLHIVNRYGI